MIDNTSPTSQRSTMVPLTTMRTGARDLMRPRSGLGDSSSRLGQLASFSDMTVTGNGHLMPNSASFQRNPCSLSGS